MYKKYLAHYGVPGMKKGVRRYQNEDGTLTSEGEDRYNSGRKVKSYSSEKAAPSRYKYGSNGAGNLANGDIWNPQKSGSHWAPGKSRDGNINKQSQQPSQKNGTISRSVNTKTIGVKTKTTTGLNGNPSNSAVKKAASSSNGSISKTIGVKTATTNGLNGYKKKQVGR